MDTPAELTLQVLVLACLLGGLLAAVLCLKRVLQLQKVGRQRLDAGVKRQRLRDDAQVAQASRAVRWPLGLAVLLLMTGLLLPAIFQRVLG